MGQLSWSLEARGRNGSQQLDWRQGPWRCWRIGPEQAESSRFALGFLQIPPEPWPGFRVPGSKLQGSTSPSLSQAFAEIWLAPASRRRSRWGGALGTAIGGLAPAWQRCFGARASGHFRDAVPVSCPQRPAVISGVDGCCRRQHTDPAVG